MAGTVLRFLDISVIHCLTSNRLRDKLNLRRGERRGKRSRQLPTSSFPPVNLWKGNTAARSEKKTSAASYGSEGGKRGRLGKARQRARGTKDLKCPSSADDLYFHLYLNPRADLNLPTRNQLGGTGGRKGESTADFKGSVSQSTLKKRAGARPPTAAEKTQAKKAKGGQSWSGQRRYERNGEKADYPAQARECLILFTLSTS